MVVGPPRIGVNREVLLIEVPQPVRNAIKKAGTIFFQTIDTRPLCESWEPTQA
jgi:hypothetical protein